MATRCAPRTAAAVWALAVVSIAGTSRAQPAEPALAVVASGCAPSWWDEGAFRRVLAVELAADDLRVAPSGTATLGVETTCETETVTLVLDGERRAIAVADVATSVRMRALALAAHDFVAEWRQRRPTPAEPAAEVLRAPEAPPLPSARTDDAGRLGLPYADTPPPPPERWLAIEVQARASWIGLSVVAPALAVEGEARIVRTPLALWVAVLGRYAQVDDALGQVRAFDVGATAGARLVLDLAPVALTVGVGVHAAWAHVDGIASVGAHGSALDGALVGIDAALSGRLALGDDLALTLALGGVGYLRGLEARAESRVVIPYREFTPSVALGLRVVLP